jgi:hypothetical protein
MYERECLGNISFLTEQATQFNRVLLDVSNPRPRYSGKKPERGGGEGTSPAAGNDITPL